MSLGTILVLVIDLIGGLSVRGRRYGYGMGHSGIGIGAVVLLALIVLIPLHKL